MKNRPCCRCFYKIPYFIKNTILLVIMGVLMLWIYLVNFNNSQFELKAVYKILAGLHSHTFNFFERYHQDLNIKKEVKQMKNPTETDFYMTCVSKNRPCNFPGLASDWTAVKKWNKDGYLKTMLGQTPVSAYPPSESYSFSGESKNFAPKDVPVNYVIRDKSVEMWEKIAPEISYPAFYNDIGQLAGTELITGSHFTDKTHYTRTDHFLCVVGGQALVNMVPHIYRHEIYGGRGRDSPLNLFDMDLRKYPKARLIPTMSY